MMFPSGNGWFALSVKPRHEKTVARALRAKQLDDFLPLYREWRAWSDRVRAVELPLFAGYVFCRFGYGDRLTVLNTPGVTSILGDGSGPARIPDEEIAAIRTVVDSGVPAKPWPFLKNGQQVRVERGPLAGMQGFVLRNKSATCVVISVEILQRSVAAEVERGTLRPLYTPAQTALAVSCAV